MRNTRYAQLGLTLLILPAIGCGGGSNPPPEAPTLSWMTVSPADGSNAADPATQITITFDRSLNASAVQPDWIRVTSLGGPLPGSPSVAPGNGRRLIWTPSAPVPASVDIVVRVDESVAATDGTTLNETLEWSFRYKDGSSLSVISVGSVVTLADSSQDLEFKALLPGRGGQPSPSLTWSDDGDVLHNVFQLPSGQWTQVLEAPAGGPSEVFERDGEGGMIVRSSFGGDFVRFTNGLEFGTTPQFLGRVRSVFTSQLTLVAEDLGFGLPATAAFQAQALSWAVSNSQNPSTVDFSSGQLLPSGIGEFQRFEGRSTPSGGWELAAEHYSSDGLLVDTQALDTGDTAWLPLAVDQAANGSCLALLVDVLSDPYRLGHTEYTAGGGWTSPAEIQGSGSGLLISYFARLNDNGAAMLCIPTPNAEAGTLVMTRPTGAGSWDLASFPDFTPLSAAVSSEGDFLLVGVAQPSGAISLLGRDASGSKAWSEPTSVVDLGIVDAGLGTFLAQTVAGHQGLVVAGQSVSVSTAPVIITTRIRAAEVSVQ